MQGRVQRKEVRQVERWGGEREIKQHIWRFSGLT